jgi:transcriptional regulator with XRE-family HTH domain
MKESLRYKLKLQRMSLSRLANLLGITRPTIYRYLKLFDQGEIAKLPMLVVRVFTTFDNRQAPFTQSLSLPELGDIQQFIPPHDSLKTLLKKHLDRLDDEKDYEFLKDLFIILKDKKSQSMLRLVHKLSQLTGQHLPSGKLEHEIEWLLDYILYKHGKQNVKEIHFLDINKGEK